MRWCIAPAGSDLMHHGVGRKYPPSTVVTGHLRKDSIASFRTSHLSESPMNQKQRALAFPFIQVVLVVVPLDEPWWYLCARPRFVDGSARGNYTRTTCHSSLLLGLRERFGYCGYPIAATVDTSGGKTGGKCGRGGGGVGDHRKDTAIACRASHG
jgi:hypothetical protein